MPLVRKDPPASLPTAPAIGAEALRTGSRSERWAAARAMALEEHVEALGVALQLEQESSVREAILTSLMRIGSERSAAAILPCLRSDQANVRTAALDALRTMPGAAAPLLPALLRDADADVRLLSCEIVRMLPSQDATPFLIEVLKNETHANVCSSAVEVLAEIGDRTALPVLRSASARFKGEPFLQFSIDAAIERIESSADAHRD